MLKTQCPSDRDLQDLLEGLADRSAANDLSRHIDLCEVCQDRLEELTAAAPHESFSENQHRVWNRMFGGRLPNISQHDATVAPGDTATIATDFEYKIPEIPGYEDLEEIARGGMGILYRACHVRLGRDVAIKVLARTREAKLTARFEREMKAVGLLSHANIVQGFDAGEFDGTPFIVMELLDGQPLSELVDPTEPIPIKDACECIRQAALGLQAAHDAGLVHRDIKPSNLMLTEDGTVKLLDLGLVGFEQQPVDGRVTEETTIMGSLDFMSPEQALDTSQADARSDVYSLGCALFALLTGRAPFEGTDFRTAQQKLLAHATADRPSVKSIRDDVPEELDQFVHRLISIDASERPATAAEVAEHLDGFRTGAVHQDGGTNRPRRNRTAAWFGGFVLLLGIVIIIKFKDGTEKRIEVDADSADVAQVMVEGLKSTDAASISVVEESLGTKWPDGTPEFAILPFSAEEATARQAAWLQYLSLEKDSTNSLGQVLRMIPPGEFRMGTMGATADKILETYPDFTKHQPDEMTERKVRTQSFRHRVRLTNALLMAAHPVTIKQYHEITGTDLSQETRKRYRAMPEVVDVRGCPARVTWIRAIEFCNTLSELEKLPPYYEVTDEGNVLRKGGTGYRLPTEAEWEFACRSGSDDSFWNDGVNKDLKHYAWFREDREDKSYFLHPVGLKAANGFGLHDMLGGAAEWCFDRFDANWYSKSPVADPAGPATGDKRVRRSGGDFAGGFRIGSGTRSSGARKRSIGSIRLVRTMVMADQ